MTPTNSERVTFLVRATGFVILWVGLAALSADIHVAYLDHTSAHMLNALVSLTLIYVGLRLWLPSVGQTIAKEILSYVPALGYLKSGGRREYDPPRYTGERYADRTDEKEARAATEESATPATTNDRPTARRRRTGED